MSSAPSSCTANLCRVDVTCNFHDIHVANAAGASCEAGRSDHFYEDIVLAFT